LADYLFYFSGGPAVLIHTFGIYHPKREKIPMCKINKYEFVVRMKHGTDDKSNVKLWLEKSK
jgi:ribosomal protein S16